MKIILIAVSFLVFALSAFSQANQQELEQRLKDAQKMFDGLTPEQKKMMESMGIQVPANTNVPVQQGATTMQVLGEAVPQRDEQRIATATKETVTQAGLPAFLKKIKAELLTAYSGDEIAICKEAYETLGKKVTGSQGLANSAIMLWMTGKNKAAIYFLASEAEKYPDDLNLLNNYAAVLSMAGGEQLAIPLLGYISSQVAQNSTVCNNLGQAWFGLGDTEKANSYLDCALKLYPRHPQAGFSKAVIEEDKGSPAKAIELVKNAIHDSYSLEKENKLRKMNYKLQPSDLHFQKKYKPDSDPLGLHNFEIPPVPRSYDELEATENNWIEFREQIAARAAELSQRRTSVLSEKQKKFNENVTNYLNNKPVENDNKEIRPFYYHQAKIMLDALNKDGGNAFRLKSTKKAFDDFMNNELKQMMPEYRKELENLEKKSLSMGNSREGGEKSELMCAERKALMTKYLKVIGPQLDELHRSYIRQLRLSMNEEIFWKQYAQFQDEFEKTKVDYQLQYLSAINLTLPTEFETIEFCNNLQQDDIAGQKLPVFKDINCEEKETIDFGWAEIETDCHKVTSKINIDILGIKLFEAEMLQNHDQVTNWKKEWWQTAADSYVKCTIEAGISASKGFEKGPLKLEAEIEGGVIVEFDRNGFSDFGVKASAEIKAGVNIEKKNKNEEDAADLSATIIGIESKMTINSGFSTKGKGVLERLERKGTGPLKISTE